jgi:hypothetical protein
MPWRTEGKLHLFLTSTLNRAEGWASCSGRLPPGKIPGSHWIGGWVSCSASLGLNRVFNLKVDRVLIWVTYLLRFTTCYITQITCIYSKCWKWCPFISMHLSTRFAMFLTTFLPITILVQKCTCFTEFFNHFRNSTFYWRLPSKFFKETLSTVGVKTSFLNNFPK